MAVATFISRVLGLVRETAMAATFGASGLTDAFTVAYRVPNQYRGTNWWDKNDNCEASADEFVMIDHVLVTSGILDRVENVGIYQGYPEYCGKMNSDHYPVIVNLRI